MLRATPWRNLEHVMLNTRPDTKRQLFWDPRIQTARNGANPPRRNTDRWSPRAREYRAPFLGGGGGQALELEGGGGTPRVSSVPWVYTRSSGSSGAVCYVYFITIRKVSYVRQKH